MRIRISRGDKNGRLPIFRMPEKRVGLRRRHNCLHRDLRVSRRRILESHRTRKPGHKLPVDLALRGARANGAPTHQIRHVLRRDHVQKFSSRGHAHFGQIQQQMARQAQAIVDPERFIEIRIVQQSFPTQVVRGFSK